MDDAPHAGLDPEQLAGLRVLLESVIGLGADLDREKVLARLVAAARAVSGAGSGSVEIHGDGDGDGADRAPGAGDLRAMPDLPPVEPGPELDLPLVVGEEVRGRLRLAEPTRGGEFGAEEVRAVRAVLAMASHVLANVDAHEDVADRHRWAAAGLSVVEALGSTAPVDEVLSTVASALRSAAGATAAAVIVPDGDGISEVRAADVLPDAVPEARSLVREVLPRLEGAAEAELPTSFHHEAGLVVVLPLRPQLAESSLLVVWFRGRCEDLPPDDLALCRALADHATMALDRARAAEQHHELALVSDRERIARDLHDLVIQRIFATGLMLRVLGRQDDLAQVRAGLDSAVAELDETIRDIRSTIFELQHSRSPSLRADVRSLAREYAGPLGFAPVVRTRGPVDTLVDRQTAEHLLATLREALSNTTRHAGAAACHVDVEVNGRDVRLVVLDDGVGPAGRADGPGGGLANLRRRAEQLGGTLDVAAAEPRGTRVVWRVPLDGPGA